MSWYLSMLRTKVREFVVNTQYWTLVELQLNARKREIEIETRRKEEGMPFSEKSQSAAKWFKSTNSRYGAVEYGSFGCSKCGNFHDGVCWSFVCRKYVKDGNFCRDCRQSAQVCFHCDQVGHIKACFPLLIFVEVKNPTPLVWLMSDGCQGRDEVPRMEGRAYQLIA